MTMAWFEDIYLEDEQRVLLSYMVERERSLMPEQSAGFALANTSGGCFLLHPFLADRPVVRQGDLDSLTDCRLLRRSLATPGSAVRYLYDVTPLGRKYYAQMKRKASEAITAIGNEIRSFIDAEWFVASFPGAHDRWQQAAQDLWDAESQAQMTRIGHTCREALQEFAAVLAQQKMVDVPSDPAKTVQAIRAVLGQRQRGNSEDAFLNALLRYWGTISDLVQRQEHGGAKEGEPLSWEDARRVVFQTAIVMFEVAKATS
jgi:hypothetical protein